MLGVSVAGFPRARIEPPTLIGISAVLMWSATIGLYRNISETFGAVGGSALIFTFSGIVATLYGGRAAFRGHSRLYLLVGGAMFVTYEIALALAVGLAQDRTQTVEVGMINYLWPCFTIALAVMVGQARADLLLVPGVMLSLAGVLLASSGSGFSLHSMLDNVAGNPLPYFLALVAAITWPLYTIFTRRLSGGKSAVPPFLLMTAALLWVYYFASNQPPLHFDLRGLTMTLLFGVLTTLAYSAWTHGVSHGNLTLMATASYFTPLLSVMLSSILLNMMPGMNFWGGALLVTGGSLVCWFASRQ
ncbi:aromatic amino acid DMT transporter YddG [Kaistia nematophila]|uniref:Aromatic amino acid DMT transporter YddG n=1 Tax=Kaistia nematophila TaxID=2994654 RepID=A0A9X3IJU3_9HYPH|nr:aromatic amino acid DMT transporter YddG [Kaistia nematophila]MCX5568788.1 aromatic amino acid DMT transporter YddG [Kaistia nematophila]